MVGIAKLGFKTLVATALLSSVAQANFLDNTYIGVEGAILSTNIDASDGWRADDPSDVIGELSLKFGKDFDIYRVWTGYSYKMESSDKSGVNDSNYSNNEIKFQSHNIILGAGYTPSINDNFKALIGAYVGVAITKGESIDTAINGSTEKVGDTKTGGIFGLKLGGIYAINDNNEIEFGLKSDYTSTGIEGYKNRMDYGAYLGYNYKF